MWNRNISLKPFKYDKSDDKRIFDLIRAIIIFKECQKINFNDKKLLSTIRLSRLDIPQYIKLKKKYPIINLVTLKRIARDFNFNVVIWTKVSSRAKPEKVFETKDNEWVSFMNLLIYIRYITHQF